MTQFIVEVEDAKKSRFIYNLLREFDYVKIKRKKKALSAEDKRILGGIEEAVQELNLYKQGKIELQDAASYIAELKAEGYL
ncbi:MAG: hypothetical protein MUE30_17405 [Spirosomaceae bacterium]|nr:hypothetical protein [Spirosomataceae bacterium]